MLCSLFDYCSRIVLGVMVDSYEWRCLFLMLVMSSGVVCAIVCAVGVFLVRVRSLWGSSQLVVEVVNGFVGMFFGVYVRFVWI